MYEESLKRLGLTKNEVSAYLSLLKGGKSKSGEIVRSANISGGKIYETLYKLIDKGLVKEVIENGVKHFIANDPKTLLTYIREKESAIAETKTEIEKILPTLEGIAKLELKLETVSLIKGFRGISPAIYGALNDGNKIQIMGVRSSKDVKFNNFWKKWHSERVHLKKNAQLLFSDKGTEYWRFFSKLPYTEVKEILSFNPSAIMIIDNNIFIFSYEEEFTCIHIKSPSISKSFSSFFESLWKIAED